MHYLNNSPLPVRGIMHYLNNSPLPVRGIMHYLNNSPLPVMGIMHYLNNSPLPVRSIMHYLNNSPLPVRSIMHYLNNSNFSSFFSCFIHILLFLSYYQMTHQFNVLFFFEKEIHVINMHIKFKSKFSKQVNISNIFWSSKLHWFVFIILYML